MSEAGHRFEQHSLRVEININKSRNTTKNIRILKKMRVRVHAVLMQLNMYSICHFYLYICHQSTNSHVSVINQTSLAVQF